MSKVKITAFSVSIDGYGAGTDQSLENPLGKGGGKIHSWMYPTKMFQKMIGKDGGTEGIDNDFAEKSMENCGAWIMGRNMFGPIRGPWPDDEWKGWWGDNPPYHVGVFVLTNHVRESVKMDGGTTFHFITDGIESALEKAKEVADGKDIRIGGGVSTIRQFLQAGFVDEVHFAISPVLLGSGENFFREMNLPKLGFSQVQKVNGEKATHIVLTKR